MPESRVSEAKFRQSMSDLMVSLSIEVLNARVPSAIPPWPSPHANPPYVQAKDSEKGYSKRSPAFSCKLYLSCEPLSANQIQDFRNGRKKLQPLNNYCIFSRSHELEYQR